MKLLVISPVYPPSACGEATNTYFLCQHLVESGLSVHLLTSRMELMPDTTVQMYAAMQSWNWREVLILIQVLRTVRPQAVLLMYFDGIYNCHPMITFTPSLIKRMFPEIRVVTRFEQVLSGCGSNDWPSFTRGLRRFFAGLFGTDGVDYRLGTLIRDSDSLIVLCEYHAEFLSRLCDKASKKISLIPPPPNIPVATDGAGVYRRRGRLLVGAQDSDLVFAYMGYVYPNKGVDTLLKAFRLLLDRRRDVFLLIIGGDVGLNSQGSGGYFKKMVSLAEQLALGNKVVWTGALALRDANWPAYLHAADFGVLPFDKGVYLNNSSFASMMAYGLPIITTRGIYGESAIAHEDNVICCEPCNPKALASAMERLADNPDLQDQIRAGAIRLFNECYAWRRAIDRTIEALSANVTDSPSNIK